MRGCHHWWASGDSNPDELVFETSRCAYSLDALYIGVAAGTRTPFRGLKDRLPTHSKTATFWVYSRWSSEVGSSHPSALTKGRASPESRSVVAHDLKWGSEVELSHRNRRYEGRCPPWASEHDWSGRRESNPLFPPWHGGVVPVDHDHVRLGRQVGVEPTTWREPTRSTTWRLRPLDHCLR